MKRSQVTVFVMIGLLILASALLIYYIRGKIIEKDLIPELDDVPEEFASIQEYVLECVRITSEEAVYRLGEHGGYIDVYDPEISGRNFELSPLPTSSDVIYVTEDLPVPYWWYLKTPLDCHDCLVSDEQVPSIPEIQGQIDRYVNRELPVCLDEFKTFKNTGIDIEAKDGIDTRSMIAEDEVKVYVNYPISVTRGGDTESMENFPVELDVDLMDVYNLALSISQGERDYQYLETILMHLISSYSELDSRKLPPIAAFDSGFVVVNWNRVSTMFNLQRLLLSHVGFIQVENTKDFREIELQDEFAQRMYDVFTLRNNGSYPDTTVNFAYLDWPIDFDITPRSGEILKPTSYRREYPFGVMSTTQTNHYEFFYDVAFPVLVEIRDESAFSGTGYSFLIALEGNVVDNKNLALWHAGEGTYGPWDYSKVEYGLKIPGVLEPNITTYIPEIDDIVVEPYEEPEKKLFCNPNQRISGNITVFARDSETRAPVSGVKVVFGCGNYANCLVGTTNSQGKYNGRMPICIGEGYIQLEKPGYMPVVESGLSIRPNVRGRYDMKIAAMKKLTSDVRLIDQDSVDGFISIGQALNMQSNARYMDDESQAIITIKKIKDSPYEPDYSQFLMLNGRELGDVSLSEGKYTLDITYIDNTGFFIDGHNESVSGSRVWVPDLNMTPALLGGAILNQQNGPWVVTSNHLKFDELRFYSLVSKKPRLMQELENISRYEPLSAQYPHVITPRFE